MKALAQAIYDLGILAGGIFLLVATPYKITGIVLIILALL